MKHSLALVLLCAGAAAQGSDQRSWTVSADVVYTAAGDPIEGGLVRVQDGDIVAVGPGDGGELQAAAVTPGMIDLSARIHLGLESVEQSQEVTPWIHAGDALDLFDPAWARHARSGITTVLVNPLDRDVIGGYGVALKTAGSDSVAARTVAAEAVMRAAMGSEPSRGNRSFGSPAVIEDFYQRRPTTRMGVEWALRKAFYDVFYARQDQADLPGKDDLGRVLDGELPFCIQAWTTQDVRTSVFLKEEIEREGMGHPRFIIDAAAEAWREPDLVVRSGCAVVLPPLPSGGRTTDGAFMAADSARVLMDLGVPVALSAHGLSEVGSRLDRQAGLAMRAGLTRAEALAAVTINPARMIGIDDRVGSIEPGKDADLVLWSGPPFELGSRVVGVLIDGRLVLDPRSGG